MNSCRMSFQDIVRLYQRPLYWYIRRVVLVHEDTEDILQETFIKAYRHLWMLRNDSALKPWLYRIATNEVNRYFRKHRETLSLEDVSGMDFISCDSPSPGKAYEVVSSALLRMSPLQREVFCLKYYEDMDYDSISRITGSGKNTLMVSYHEARKKIEKEIDK